jgi:hypothetical protein
MSVIDVFQYGLRKLAGLDVYYVGDSAVGQTGDIALAFIRSVFDKNSAFPALKNAFWSLVILGILLLFVTTIIAIIRQEYMPGQEEIKMKERNGKIYVVTRSVKSLFMFLIVPVSVIFGLMLGDIFLQAFDRATSTSDMTSVLFQNSQATSKLLPADVNGRQTYIFYDIYGAAVPTSSTSISGQMFKVSAFTSSRIRRGEEYGGKTYYELLMDGELSNFEIFNLAKSEEEMADMVDEAFANHVHLQSSTDRSIRLGPTAEMHGGHISVKEGKKVSSFSKYNVGLVWYFYNLWHFNFLIGFAFFIVTAQLLVNAMMGLAKRIIEMVALFIISPPIIATMPLDEGKAFQKWRQNFISKAMGSFGVILGLNLLFIILPYLHYINLFPNTNFAYKFINLLFATIFTILALTLINSFVAMISKMLGGDDVVKSGSSLVGEVGGAMKKSATFLGGATGIAVSTVSGAAKIGAKTGIKVADKFTGGQVSQMLENRRVEKEMKKQQQAESLNFWDRKLSKKEIEKAGDDWEHGGSDEAYTEKMNQDSDYKKEMERAHKAYTKEHGNVDFDDWAKTDEGKQAQQQAEQNYANKVGQNREQFRNNQAEKDKYIARKVKPHTSRRRAGIVKSIIDSTGLSSAATTGELFSEEMKDAFVRGGGKGGFAALINAFKGKSAYDIELAGVKKKVQKEESMRARVQMEQQNKKGNK